MNKRSDKTRTSQQASSKPLLGRAWIAITILLVIVFAIRMRLLDIPLERDEGEYAYMGQLILHGIPPYSLAYTMKFPGTALMYALFMGLFGQTVQGVHLGLLLVNGTSIVLVFLIGRKLFSDIAAVTAAIAFAFLSLNHSVLGFAAHATHYVMLTTLAGTLALLVFLEKKNTVMLFFSGVLLGLAPVMKQQGFPFILFGVLYLAYDRFANTQKPPRQHMAHDLAAYAGGALLPLCLIIIWSYLTGSLERFCFWTFTYAREYGTMVSWSRALSKFTYGVSSLVDGFALLWCLAIAGLTAAFYDTEKKGQRAFLLLFSACSFLAFCPGFYFRPHYFITFLPAAALATGYGINRVWRMGLKITRMPYMQFAGIALFTLAIALGLYSENSYFFKDPPATLIKEFYHENPFTESLEIAEFIRANSHEDDTIAVFGSEPQIYFYANRRSATGYIYMYGMMEDHPYNLIMQKEMLQEVKTAKPRFIVFTSIPGSWLSTPRSDRSIIKWLSDYQNKHYTLVGIADIVSDTETVYKWHDDARAYAFQTPRRIYVLERNNEDD